MAAPKSLLTARKPKLGTTPGMLRGMNKPTRLVAALFGVAAIIYGVYQMKLGLFGQSKTAQEVGDRITLTKPTCSLRVPKGWGQEPSGNGGTMLSAPKTSGHAANLSIAGEPFAGTVREYADVTIKAVKEAMKDAKVTADAPFTTDAGLPAIKVTFLNQFQGKEITQALYFYDVGAGQKLVATASMPAQDAGELMALFDGCLKTVEVK